MKKHEISLQGVNMKSIKSLIKDGSAAIENAVSIDETESSVVSVHKTTDLLSLNDPPSDREIVSFFDESKRPVLCNVSKSNLSEDRKDVLLSNCFWCKHPFDTQPIGCPVRYISRQAVRRYQSGISKDIYTIKENITDKRAESLVENETLKIQAGDYYETDGCFCSFNCCQSWINDNKHDRLYDQSSMLLKKLYMSIYSIKFPNIVPAPHWRLLRAYGGHLNIIEFRESFNKVEYEPHGTITPRPKFLPIARLFEERYRF